MGHPPRGVPEIGVPRFGADMRDCRTLGPRPSVIRATTRSPSGPASHRTTSPKKGDVQSEGEISRRAQLLREYTGRGPTKARTTINHESAVVLLQETLTKAERKLAENGKGRGKRPPTQALWIGVPISGGGRHCPGVRGTHFRCLLRAFPPESDLGNRFGQSAGHVPGATPSEMSPCDRGSGRLGKPAI